MRDKPCFVSQCGGLHYSNHMNKEPILVSEKAGPNNSTNGAENFFSAVECNKCHPSFQDTAAYSRPIRHSDNRHACRYCEAVSYFNTIMELRRHYNDLHKGVYCVFCDSHFFEDWMKHEHMRNQHARCDGCDLFFETWGILAAHRVEVHAVPEPAPWPATAQANIVCRYCQPVLEFNDHSELRMHYVSAHSDVYCAFCDIRFAKAKNKDKHMAVFHRQCQQCLRYFHDRKDLARHSTTEHTEPFDLPWSIERTRGNVKDHYSILAISPQASQEEMLKAAKAARINSHPDRLKRQEGLTDEQMLKIDLEAALVGQAADVLCNPGLRFKYDMERDR